MDLLSVHIILSEDASSLLQATYPSSHLNCSALGPFFERFFILGGPRGSSRKNSKFGLNEYSVQDEKLTCTCIHKSVLIIDCCWHGFGGMEDIFDLIVPPTVMQVFGNLTPII